MTVSGPMSDGAGLIDDRSFPRMAAIAAMASLPLAAGNLIAMLATVHFNLNGMTDPLVLLHAGKAAAPLWRWSMVLDIFGYYLLIVPLILLCEAPSGPGARTGLTYSLSASWPTASSALSGERCWQRRSPR